MFSLHDYNEDSLIKKIEKYQYTSSFALISDAGSPLISDPGYKLVKNFINKGVYVTTIPGPSSVISSLQLSGLAVNNFRFYGFVPKNKGSENNLIESILYTSQTSIFFISGGRLEKFLENVKSFNINPEIAICKEISKKNETVFRGSLLHIIEEINLNHINFKGEFVLLIETKNKTKNQNVDISIEKHTKKIMEKFSLTEAVEIVHNLSNISKKEIYRLALKLKND